MTEYLFSRCDGFYTVLLKDDDDAVVNAKCNPGTLRVENIETRRVVWDAITPNYHPREEV